MQEENTSEQNQDRVSFEGSAGIRNNYIPATSNFSDTPGILDAQLIELSDGEGAIVYYPRKGNSPIGVNFKVGEVLFLKEKTENNNVSQPEQGLVVQIIALGAATYPQADIKALFRLTVNVRAQQYKRSANESPEVMDEFLEARFKVRNYIENDIWQEAAGRVVTRNIDIFRLSPTILTNNIFTKVNLIKVSEDAYRTLLDRFPENGRQISSFFRRRERTENGSTDIQYYGDSTNLLNNQDIPSELKSALKKLDLNVDLGEYIIDTENRVSSPVEFYGGGFEKINLITGMKGGGKSHIAKGIIAESINAGMSAIVFDVNNEYEGLTDESLDNAVNGRVFTPGQDLRFRLDRMHPGTFINLVKTISPFSERTEIIGNAALYRLIRENAGNNNFDIDFLIEDARLEHIFPDDSNTANAVNSMRQSFRTSLRIVNDQNLIMNRRQIAEENSFLLRRTDEAPEIFSLSTVLEQVTEEPGLVVFKIGGLLKNAQYAVVDMVIDTLKEICKRQTEFAESRGLVPTYPTVFFEEAHMYLDSRTIDELLPVIRHHGMNVFFITNTPIALPESVFRLIDNLIMTKLLNKRDIDQLKNCGLADGETIEGFAKDLPRYHALLLSAKEGTTKGFPLVFRVRDFGLPPSGISRSMWNKMRDIYTENMQS